MASLGASVVVVEPDKALATAISETVAANCWDSSLVTVHNKMISANPYEDGQSSVFRGGWRMDDPGVRTPRASRVEVISLQKVLKAHTHWDFIKIDIDNHIVESALLVAIERLITSGELTVNALIIEVRRDPSRGEMAAALSRFQLTHGFTVFRLAHLLQSTQNLEPWYAECYAVRALRYALRVRPLTHAGWARALALAADAATGKRSESTSLLLSRTPIGSGPEELWHSAADSFDLRVGPGKLLGSCYRNASVEFASDGGDTTAAEVAAGRAAPSKAHAKRQARHSGQQARLRLTQDAGGGHRGAGATPTERAGAGGGGRAGARNGEWRFSAGDWAVLIGALAIIVLVTVYFGCVPPAQDS